MEIKLFEVRDIATFMPVMCIRLLGRDHRELFLLDRAGYATHYSRYIIYIPLETLEGVAVDYSDWGSSYNRTHYYSHKYIEEHWDELKSGDVIDVQFILGETKEPKISEQKARKEKK